MTNSLNNTPPNPEPERQNPLKHLLNSLQSSRKKLTVGLAAIATLGILGYAGVQYLVKKKLPPFLETQIGNIIDRPIDLGEVTGFSLAGIEFGQTIIPPTAQDPDKISVAGIEVDFNIFPVIFRRSLPADITLIQPQVYLEQSANGAWVNLDFLQRDPNQEQRELPLKLNLDVDLEETNITLVPYQKSAIAVGIDGSARYNETAAELVSYDLDVTIEKAKAKLQGATQLETGTTETKLLVKDLALADVATLLPNSPVTLNNGVLNSDLNIEIPSFAEITSANITGLVSINDVAGEVTALSTEVKAESELDFAGKNAQIKQTQASLGDIVAQVAGTLNLDTGYDLDVKVLPFRLSSLPGEIDKLIPIALGGEVTAALKLQGEIQEPLLTGRVNNTQNITVDKTQFKRLQADFNADLTQVVLENLQIIPLAGGAITAEGIILTKIEEDVEGNQDIETTKMPLEFNFKSILPTQDLVSPYFQLPTTVAIGNLNAEGKVTGTVDNLNAVVNWQIPETQTANAENISGSGEFLLENNQLRVQNTQVKLGDGIAEVKASTNLDNKQWQTNIAANSLPLTTLLTQFTIPNLNLDRPIALENADIKLNGKLDELDPNKVTGIANLNLNIDRGLVAVTSKLNSGIIEATTTTDNIDLHPFVDLLPVPVTIDSGIINVSGKLEQLLAFADEKKLDSFTVDAALDLDLDDNYVAVDSTLDSGIISGNIDTNRINLNRIAPILPVNATVRSSRTSFTGELQQLLTLPENLNLSSLQVDSDADLTVAGGSVNAIAKLDNNQFLTNIDANNISSSLLLQTFAPANLTSLNLDNIDTQIDISGDISPLMSNQVNLPLAINSWAIQSGEQNLKTQGNLTLSNITTDCDVASTNLDVEANIDLNRLPIQPLLASVSENNQFVADSIYLGGKIGFDGELSGKNLISAPLEPGNISLVGDLTLLNLAFNDIEFDSELAGTVNIQPESTIAVNLKGKQDVIAASAVACQDQNCLLPYVPTNLEFRQGETTSQPIIVTGKNNQNLFALDINNFPLALLNLAPGKVAGIRGPLTGSTTGDITLDFNTLATQGTVTVTKPGVGYILADRLAADFNYDPNSNIAEVTTASLDLGQSKYNANASLNLQTGAIAGELKIPEAYIQDTLTSFRWFNIADVINLFNIPDYAPPEDIDPSDEIDTVGQAIALKLERLRQIENRIQEIAATREKASIPTELDIQGKYTGAITFGGTLKQPEANFKIAANDWQWQPQPKFYNFDESVGLVREEGPQIKVPQILIAGNLQGTVVKLEVAKLQLENATFSATGELSPLEQDLNFKLSDLSLETINQFFALPIDIAGEIDVTGNLTGRPTSPQITGEVAFVDGTFNGEPLPEKFLGNFDYDGTKLEFATSEPSSIQVEATVPYPIVSGKSDRVAAEVKLDTEAFALLGIFSNGYLNWAGGSGDADLKFDARLDLTKDLPLSDHNATGSINLDNSQVNLETPYFSAPFQGTGQIKITEINDKIVAVADLTGTFAEKDLVVAGSLPILSAVNQLENPLNVELNPGEINIDNLYKGGVAGNIKVTGSALQPIIGGEVTLEDGRVYVPKTAKTNSKSDENQVISNNSRPDTETKANNNQNSPSYFVTALKDFQVNLIEIFAQQRPWYRFNIQGGLRLNGTVDQPNNIKPAGTITLGSGWVNFLSNQFDLNRSRENKITFSPNAGVLNPYLDIQFRTIVNEFDQADVRIADLGSNEIRDPISQTNYRNSITVNLVIDGETAVLLPNLVKTNNTCVIGRQDNFSVASQGYYTETELQELTRCFNIAAFAQEDELLTLNSVELTSIPYRSEGEIASLLGNEFLSFAERLNNSSQSELFDLGVNTFILDPLYRRAFYAFDDKVVEFGRKIGLDYLHLLPDLEGVYEINNRSSIRSSYNYGIPNSHEVRLEYRLRF